MSFYFPCAVTIRERKRLFDAARKPALEKERKQRRLQWRCWWTWPIGHRWTKAEASSFSYEWKCVICGKVADWDSQG